MEARRGKMGPSHGIQSGVRWHSGDQGLNPGGHTIGIKKVSGYVIGC